jgi:fatty-acyl-CoA synthase
MKIADRLTAAVVVTRANLVWPERTDRWPLAWRRMWSWGLATFPGSVGASAARFPDTTAIIDDDGSYTYRELWARTDALAGVLVTSGVGPGSRVGVLARNHRGFVESTLAAAKTGADIVFLNTGMAADQLVDVIGNETIDTVLCDDEFATAVAASPAATRLSQSDMAAASTDAVTKRRIRPPASPGAMIVLTSGTTGRPKGARRGQAGSLEGVAALLERIPLRARDTTIIGAPLFHAWGLAHSVMALGMSATLVLQRRFDAETTLALIERHRARTLVVVPLMLQRIVSLDPEVLARYDTSSLGVIASGGSALGGKLATDVMNRFGPVLYNTYGSTEAAMATVATPHDLRQSPATAGRVVTGVRVEILDDAGEPAPAGQIGRIFVGNPLRFDGYTGGGGKESRRGLLSSGDLGHFDDRGRLFIDGREDDMIISGGENVYPAEVEELLAHHPGIAEVAVVGVEDAEFGQALKAYVVRRPIAELDADTVRHYVRDHLARFKVPRQVEFLDELPRNATGKVMKRSLG